MNYYKRPKAKGKIKGEQNMKDETRELFEKSPIMQMFDSHIDESQLNEMIDVKMTKGEVVLITSMLTAYMSAETGKSDDTIMPLTALIAYLGVKCGEDGMNSLLFAGKKSYEEIWDLKDVKKVMESRKSFFS